MSDSYVQVQTDGAGKKVDASALIVPDGTVSPPTIYRQRVAIGSDTDENGMADVVASTDNLKALRVEDYAARQNAEDLLAEARVQTALMCAERYGTGERSNGTR